MSIDERDLRMVVVAFEDAVTWCETVADLADKLIEAARTHRQVPQNELQSAVAQLADTRRYLQSNENEVQRIKHRVGIV
jgi:hypothetical protein